jgi:hypothetical protein
MEVSAQCLPQESLLVERSVLETDLPEVIVGCARAMAPADASDALLTIKFRSLSKKKKKKKRLEP